MINLILEPFDWLLSLPIERLFHLTTGLSLSAFCAAAIMRELFADKGIRWAARMLGVGAIFISVCFGNYATHKLLLANESMAKNIATAKGVEDHHYTAIQKIKTSDGHVLEIGDSNGMRVLSAVSEQRTDSLRRGDLPQAAGSTGIEPSRLRSDGGDRSGFNGLDVAEQLLEYAGKKRWSDDFSADTSGSVDF